MSNAKRIDTVLTKVYQQYTIYNINDEKIKEILLALRAADFVSQDMSNNEKHVEDVVCKFIKVYPLMPKWKENADYEEVSLYIKMVKPQDGQPIFIISFHEAEQ